MPEALLNFLALLGWNPGTDQEIFSLEELVEAFSIERINKSGAKFDVEKLNWFNQQYIKNASDEFLANELLNQCAEANISCAQSQAVKAVILFKERISFPNQLLEKSKYLFETPLRYDEQVLTKKWSPEIAQLMIELAQKVENTTDFNGEEVKHALAQLAESKGMGLGKVMQPLRMVITGEGNGPELVDIINFIGKEELLHRLRKEIK
jgi:glutamyl-tRNA synthetase